MLDLRRLRLLRELDARGTVHAAARALDYTPSAVSQQLAVLEREAGATLLERTGRTLPAHRRRPAARRARRGAARPRWRPRRPTSPRSSPAARRAPCGSPRSRPRSSSSSRRRSPGSPREHPDVRVEASEIEVEEAVPLLRLGHLDVVVGDEYEGVPRPVWPDLVREPLLDGAGAGDAPGGPRARRPRARRARPPRRARSGSARARAPGHREMHLRVCRERGGFEPDIRFHSDDLAIQLEMVRTTGACGLLPDLVLAPRDRAASPRRSSRAAASAARSSRVTRAARTPAVEVVAAAVPPWPRRLSGAPAPEHVDDPDGEEQRGDAATATRPSRRRSRRSARAEEGAGEAGQRPRPGALRTAATCPCAARRPRPRPRPRGRRASPARPWPARPARACSRAA